VKLISGNFHQIKMSKTTSSRKFRDVNVDAYDPESFTEENIDGDDQGPNEGEVNTCLSQYPFHTRLYPVFK